MSTSRAFSTDTIQIHFENGIIGILNPTENKDNDLFYAIAQRWIEQIRNQQVKAVPEDFKILIRRFFIAYNSWQKNATPPKRFNTLQENAKAFIEKGDVHDYDSLLALTQTLVQTGQNTPLTIQVIAVFVSDAIRFIAFIYAAYKEEMKEKIRMQAPVLDYPTLLQLGNSREPVSQAHIATYLDYIELATGYAILYLRSTKTGVALLNRSSLLDSADAHPLAMFPSTTDCSNIRLSAC